MLEILRFIFGDFWVFWGMIILIYTVGMSIAMIVGAVFGCEVNASLFSNNETNNYGAEDV